jgi:RimJ/RimL family protein N-acetyltransferase
VATRAIAAVSEWALEDLGLHRLQLEHSVRNAQSCRVAHRAGFKLEGTMREKWPQTDGWHDVHLHARLHLAVGPQAGTPAH